MIEYFAFFSDLNSSEESTQGFQRDLNLHHIFKTVFRKSLPHLTGYHILQPDDAQHAHGRRHDRVREAFLFADSLVGAVIDLITELNQWPHTTLIVTGDHGHVDHHTDIRLNALLHEKGLFSVENGGITNWKAVAHPSGGAAFIHLKNPSDDAERQNVVSLLENKEWGQLIEGSDLPETLKGYGESDFVLLAEDGYNFSGELDQPFVYPHSGGGHGGDPNNPQLKTTLFAMGRGIRSGAILESSHTTQTATLIARLLDLPLKTDRPVPNILK